MEIAISLKDLISSLRFAEEHIKTASQSLKTINTHLIKNEDIDKFNDAYKKLIERRNLLQDEVKQAYDILEGQRTKLLQILTPLAFLLNNKVYYVYDSSGKVFRHVIEIADCHGEVMFKYKNKTQGLHYLWFDIDPSGLYQFCEGMLTRIIKNYDSEIKQNKLMENVKFFIDKNDTLIIGIQNCVKTKIKD